jgi:hypothetical protein
MSYRFTVEIKTEKLLTARQLLLLNRILSDRFQFGSLPGRRMGISVDMRVVFDAANSDPIEAEQNPDDPQSPEGDASAA